MTRKSINLELTGGKSKRQRIWDLIRATGRATFEAAEVTPGDIHRETAKCYLKSLVRGEYLGCNLTGESMIYYLINDAGIEAPRVTKQGEKVTQGQGNESMWGAMQALGSFNTRVLGEMAGVVEPTVKRYCTMLYNAGYLTVDRQGKGTGRGGIATQYRLLASKVNGPRPPMITRLKAVYDPNIHEIVWQQNADHAIEALEDAQ